MKTTLYSSVVMICGLISLQVSHAATMSVVAPTAPEPDQILLYAEGPTGLQKPLTTSDLGITSSPLSDDPEGPVLLQLPLTETDETVLLTTEEGSIIPPTQEVLIAEGDQGMKTITGTPLTGYIPQMDTLKDMIVTAVTSESPVIIQVPTISEEAEIFMQVGEEKKPMDVVAHGVSNFRGSTDKRIHNINTAMKRFNGFTIKQGDTFSFNDQLGEVDGSTGYEKELVIKGIRTIPEYGGGVCQVSSTVYRAAIDGALPIVERKAHSYAVGYYEPWGTDATIYPGIVDLKFENDTPGDVVMHLFTEGTTLHTLMYGVSDGRSTTLEGPNVYGHTAAPDPIEQQVSYLAPGQKRIKEYGQGGFSSWWKYTITHADGTVTEKIIDTTYDGKKGVVLVGPEPTPEETTEGE